MCLLCDAAFHQHLFHPLRLDSDTSMLERWRAQELEVAPYIYMIRACGQSGYIKKPMLREQCHMTTVVLASYACMLLRSDLVNCR